MLAESDRLAIVRTEKIRGCYYCYYCCYYQNIYYINNNNNKMG